MARQYTFIIVEKSTKSQNAFRRFFESLGIKVLVSASPSRALATIESSNTKVDGLILSSLELGHEAVEVFNSLSEPTSGEKIPAVLIVNQKNPSIVDAARCDDYRKVVFIPMNVPSVVATLSMVLRSDSPSEQIEDGELHGVNQAQGIEQDPNKRPDAAVRLQIDSYFDDDMPMPD